jgi:uncharacterized protein
MNELEPDPVDPAEPELSPWSPPTTDREIYTPPQPPVKSSRPWGPWATIGWTLVCIVVLLGVQMVAAIIFALAMAATQGNLNANDLATNGNLQSFAILLSTPATLVLIALLVWVRHYPFRDYLALRWPPVRSVVIAFWGLAVVLVGTDLTSYLTGRPIVPTVVVDLYRSSWVPGLVFAMVVLAPLGEETLFRGFLYAGIAASRAGPVVAILVSTVVFGSLHFQYDWYGMAGAAAMGLYLGVVRYRSRSLFLTMLLHAVANAFATAEMVVLDRWFK